MRLQGLGRFWRRSWRSGAVNKPLLPAVQRMDVKSQKLDRSVLILYNSGIGTRLSRDGLYRNDELTVNQFRKSPSNTSNPVNPGVFKASNPLQSVSRKTCTSVASSVRRAQWSRLGLRRVQSGQSVVWPADERRTACSKRLPAPALSSVQTIARTQTETRACQTAVQRRLPTPSLVPQ